MATLLPAGDSRFNSSRDIRHPESLWIRRIKSLPERSRAEERVRPSRGIMNAVITFSWPEIF